MNNKNFSGIFPALLTPFDKNDRVNHDVLGELVEFNIKKGVTGFYVDGSTAEAFLLSDEERRSIIKTVADASSGRATLIAHIGCISTKQAISLAEYAQKIGYDAVSSVTPFYYKFSFAEIKKYYFDIVNAVELPMLVYNFPVFSGVNLTVDNVREFLSDDRFIGIKHTSQDYFALRQFKTAFPNKMIYNGYDETFLAGLSMGADGAIGSTFNFMAEKFVKLYEFFNDGKLVQAMELQKTIDVIIAALCRCGVMQGEKALLDEMGFDFGPARAPFAPLSNEAKRELIDTVMPLL